jgi:hypothetical protein
MTIHCDFAILYPDKNDQEIASFKSFFEGYNLNVTILECDMQSLDTVVESKIRTVIVFNQLDTHFAQHFIIEASVRKIFSKTTFYYLSTTKPSAEEQMRLMTLGFSGFLIMPFNASDTQNNMDICDYMNRAA